MGKSKILLLSCKDLYWGKIFIKIIYIKKYLSKVY